MKQVGAYHSVAFDDPLIHGTIEAMSGWVDLCRADQKSLPFRSLEFQKHYVGYLEGKVEFTPAYLCGITEAENRRNGFLNHIPPVALIGNPEKAQLQLITARKAPRMIHESKLPVKELLSLAVNKLTQ